MAPPLPRRLHRVTPLFSSASGAPRPHRANPPPRPAKSDVRRGRAPTPVGARPAGRSVPRPFILPDMKHRSPPPPSPTGTGTYARRVGRLAGSSCDGTWPVGGTRAKVRLRPERPPGAPGVEPLGTAAPAPWITSPAPEASQRCRILGRGVARGGGEPWHDRRRLGRATCGESATRCEAGGPASAGPSAHAAGRSGTSAMFTPMPAATAPTPGEARAGRS